MDKFDSPQARQTQLQALAKKYPNATVYDDGDSFRVEANRPTPAAPTTEAAAPTGPRPTGVVGPLVAAFQRHPITTTLGTAVGAAFGHPLYGAEAGYAVGDALQNARGQVASMVQSPLWRTVSGTVKQSVGRALQTQDFSTVANVASKVLNGQGLEDPYGHDAALHAVLNDIAQQNGSPDPVALRQHLAQYTAVYVDKSGAVVEVPANVLNKTYDSLTGH